jgi:hypothetical protein
MKYLLKVTYQDETGKFWRDSYLNNKVIEARDGETIHETIGRALTEIDGVKLSYKGKAQGNIYVDKNEEAVKVGYLYRVQDEIYDMEDGKTHKAFFTAWATPKEVRDIEIESIDSSF